MSGFIPKDFIQDLVARADIVATIERRIALKKAGRNYQACCPFHSEKTPSFSVAPDKQFYYCFGCGTHGNALDFIMHYEGLDFPDAVEVLASEQGVDVPRVQRSSRYAGPSVDQDDYQLLKQVAGYFHNNLHQTSGQIALNYLHQRGLNDDTIKRFHIGYAKDSWNDVLYRFGKPAEQKKKLATLKVITENEQGRQYDFFRHRIIFPIRDRRGRVVGFGGRAIQDEQMPKYLNSPETPVFHKGKELFGLYELRQSKHTQEFVVIVEGYMDVVALAQYGIDCAVASLGTALTGDQIQLLFRQSKRVVCCFDGDRAGREAAWRALENALPLLHDGHDMRFLFLPDGEDPDTYIRQHGAESFIQQAQQAQPFRDYFFEHLAQQHDLTQDAGKGAFLHTAKPLIEKIQSDFYRDLFMDELAIRLGMDVSQIVNLVHLPSQLSTKRQQIVCSTPVERAIGLLIQYPHLGQLIDVQPMLSELKMEFTPIFMGLHRQTHQQRLAMADVIEGWRGSSHEETIRQFAQWEHQIDEEHIEQVFKDIFKRLIDLYLEQRYEELKVLPSQQMTAAVLREMEQIIHILKKAE